MNFTGEVSPKNKITFNHRKISRFDTSISLFENQSLPIWVKENITCMSHVFSKFIFKPILYTIRCYKEQCYKAVCVYIAKI